MCLYRGSPTGKEGSLMKKFAVCVLSGLAFISGLAGCSSRAGQTKGPGPEPISGHMLAQDVYDTLQEEWDAYDSLSAEQKLLSSSLPGACYEDFSDWAACEKFLGISLPNPLEEAAWLDRGTYVGMPEGFLDAPSVHASLYGTREGHVERICVQSGYRDGEIRVTLEAILYGAPTAGISTHSGGDVESEGRSCSVALGDGDDTALVTENSGEGSVSRTACLARDYVLYRICVIGAPDVQDDVQETLEEVLSEFENI